MYVSRSHSKTVILFFVAKVGGLFTFFSVEEYLILYHGLLFLLICKVTGNYIAQDIVQT